MALYVNGVQCNEIFVNNTPTAIDTLFVGGIVGYENYVVISTAAQAYAQLALGKKVKDVVKGKLSVTAGGILMASDGTYLGKNMEVWFNSESYALTATGFSNGCYTKATGRRCSDNKAWTNINYSNSGTFDVLNGRCYDRYYTAYYHYTWV